MSFCGPQDRVQKPDVGGTQIWDSGVVVFVYNGHGRDGTQDTPAWKAVLWSMPDTDPEC